MRRLNWRPIRLNPILALLISILIIATADYSLAVVITDGNGTGNTTPPADDPGFANIGQLNVGSGIYLGNRWVAHVGAGTITLNGQLLSAGLATLLGSRQYRRRPKSVSS